MAGCLDIKNDVSEEVFPATDSDNSTMQCSLSCTKCSLQFSSGTDLIHHLNTHTYTYPYSCTICHKVFARRQILKNHYLSHIERVYYTCPVCSKVYKSCKPFKDHLACHTGHSVENIAQYSNRLCHDDILEGNTDRQSESSDTLTETNGSSSVALCSVDCSDYQSFSPHKCAKCGQQFKRQKEFCFHLQNNSCMGPYTCSVCGKVFHQKQSLRNHYLTHQEEKIRICPVCDKTYKSMKPFTDHLARHGLTLADLQRGAKEPAMLDDNERSKREELNHVPSPSNPISTSVKASLQMDSIFDEECPFCPLVFNRHSDVDQHIQMVHSNTDQYQCFICRKVLCHPSEIHQHLVAHARSSLHICPLCEKMFDSYTSFKLHFDSVHSKSIKSSSIDSSNQMAKSSFDESNKSNSSRDELRHSIDSAFAPLPHSTKYSSNRSYTCSFCLKVFHNQSLYWDHQLTECTSDRSFQRFDHLVNDNLSFKNGLVSTTKQLYHCLQCPRSFAIQSDLRIHEQSHLNETIFKCSCGKLCENIPSFIQHLESKECNQNADLCQRNSFGNAFNSHHHALDFSMK